MRYTLMIKYNCFYVIKDEFFTRFDDPYLKLNKDEHRPHYYCIKDRATDLLWVIPLSSKIEKYRKIINAFELSGKRCDKLHITKLDDGRESAFLIQDMFPITEEYILRPYTIGDNHLQLTSEVQIRIIHKKATKILGLIKNGIRFFKTQPDSIQIQYELLNNK